MNSDALNLQSGSAIPYAVEVVDKSNAYDNTSAISRPLHPLGTPRPICMSFDVGYGIGRGLPNASTSLREA